MAAPLALPRRANPLKLAAAAQILAALLWIPQAGALAWGVGRIAAGAGLAGIWTPALAALLIGAARAGLDWLGGGLAHRAARAEVARLRREAAQALARRSPLDKTQAPSGLAASLMAEQAETLMTYLARWSPVRMKAAVVPVGIWLVVLWQSWAAALVLAMAAPLIPIFMALVGWRAQELSEKHLARLGELNAFLLDRLRGLSTIRDLGAAERTTDRVRAEAQDLRRRAMSVLRVAFLSSAVLELFAALGVALAAVYVGFHLLGELNFGAWGQKLSLSEGLFVLMLAPAFFEPLREMSAVWHDRASGEAARAALKRLEEQGPEIAPALLIPPPALASSLTAPPALRIRDLHYAPAGGPEIFAGFKLDLAPGERLALMGPSGAGKSALLALIAGLARPDEGEIRFEGLPQGAPPPIAWLGQHPHVFAASLAANVALGRPGLGREAVAEALRFAHLEREAGLRGASPLGEGGLGLSGGQIHRLALARLHAAPQARLILADEPTAHLDSETARDMLDGLLTLAEGRSLIVATHDPAVAARMDRVVILRPPLAAADEEAAA